MMPVGGSASATVAQVPGVAVESSSNAAKPGSGQLLRLRKAAGDFEAILLQSLWKSMKDTFSDPDDPDSDETLKSFDDLGVEAMASAVGSSGGLGIKNLILKHLEPIVRAGGDAGASQT